VQNGGGPPLSTRSLDWPFAVVPKRFKTGLCSQFDVICHQPATGQMRVAVDRSSIATFFAGNYVGIRIDPVTSIVPVALTMKGMRIANCDARQEVPTGGEAMSDRKIERGILEYLKRRRICGLTIWEVHAENGVATVRGRAFSKFAKRVCNECCRHVTGVRAVIDFVELAAG
jgi:hypothetical protein